MKVDALVATLAMSLSASVERDADGREILVEGPTDVIIHLSRPYLELQVID